MPSKNFGRLAGCGRDIVALYRGGESTVRLAAEYGVSPAAINALLVRLGEPRRSRPVASPNPPKTRRPALLAGKEHEIAAAYRSGLSTLSLAATHGTTPRQINHALARVGQPRRNQADAGRRYPFNEHLLDEIDSPTKAYILGLIYSDGCNYRRGRESRVSIDLNRGDTELLQRIAYEFGYGGKLQPMAHGMMGLRLKSRSLSDAVLRHGVVPAKSLVLRFPAEDVFPHDLMPHFVRGYFDGNGSVYVSRDGQRKIALVGTEQFCMGLMRELYLGLAIVPQVRESGRKNGITYECRFGGNGQAARFARWIYQDTDLFMRRKRVVFDEVEMKSQGKPT